MTPKCQCNATCEWAFPTSDPKLPKIGDVWICPTCLRINLFVGSEDNPRLQEMTDLELATQPQYLQAWFRGIQFAFLMKRKDEFYRIMQTLGG